jgi:molybdopterin-guanine dinucleotide biosynthesis protein A
MRARRDITPLCDAIILAGGEPDGMDPSAPNKTFIKIRNRSLFIHVLQALLKVERIGTIFIVGPRDEILRELEREHADIPPEKVCVKQERSNIVENVWYPFLESIEGYRPGMEATDASIRNKPVFVTSGDSPLMTPMEVDEFLNGCADLGQYCWFMGMTPHEVLEQYEPKDNRPGVRLACSHFAEDLLRINNLHLLRPFRIPNRNEFDEFYRVRHLTRYSDIVKSGIGLLKRRIDRNILTGWFEMLLAMKLREFGLNRLSDGVRKLVPIERAERVVGNLIGAPCRAVITTYGGCALDVDNADTRQVVEIMYDDWMRRQERLWQKRQQVRKDALQVKIRP